MYGPYFFVNINYLLTGCLTIFFELILQLKMFFMIKKIFTLFSKLSCIGILGLLPVAGYSQVSVQATAGVQTGTYATVNAAFAAINAGTHQGAITINVVDNTTEPATPVPLLRSNGSSSYTSILIRPQGGNFTINSAATPAANRGILELAGADNVTIDGDDPNTTGVHNLTIQAAAGTVAGVACIRLSSNSTSGTDGADNITIRNCNIIGARNSATSTTSSYGIQFSNGTSTSSSSTGAYSSINNTFENNVVKRAYYGIYAYGGSSSYLNSNLIIRNNVIGSDVSADNIGIKGIYVSYTSTSATGRAQITGNDVRVGDYGTTGYAATIAGIEVAAGNHSILVSRNNIHDIVQPHSSGYGAYGIVFSSATSTSGPEVSNNFIRDCKVHVYQTSTSSSWLPVGIYFNASVTNVKFVNNTIVMNEQVNTHATYSTYGVLVISGATFSHFLNNIIINKFGSDNSFAVYLNNTSAFTANNALVNNNCYFITGTGKLGYYGASATTLLDWRTLTGKEASSIAESPAFASATDLHIPDGTISLCESGGAAVNVTGVNVDIDGQTRPGTSTYGFGTAPDIGADEFDGRKVYTCDAPPVPGNTVVSDSVVCYGATVQLSISNTLTGTGLSYQWQRSDDGVAYTDINNAFLPTTNAVITAPAYFRLRVLCAAGTDTVYAAPKGVRLAHVISSLSSPAAICGMGQRSITATTQQPSSVVNWYNVPAGGTSLFTGNTFQTPVINTTTTYYAEPAGPGSSRETMPSPTIGASTFITSTAGWGLHFQVMNTVGIDSVTIKAVGSTAGNATIQVFITDINDVELYTGMSYTFAINSTLTEYQIPVMIPNVAPGTYKMVMRYSGINDMVRESSGVTFPYNSSGNDVSITAGANGAGNARAATSYYWFYRWVISKGCTGTRVPVTVTVTPGPAFAVSNDFTVCNNAVKPVKVTTATAGNFDEVVWTPAANLYTDAAGTIPYVPNTPLKTVYYKSATPGVFSIVANATNTTTNCKNADTVTITVLPAAMEVQARIPVFCSSGSSVLNVVNPGELGTAVVQWQESADNVSFTDIANATGLTYTTPVLTATRYYRVQLIVDNAPCGLASVSDTVFINNPSVLNVTGVASCDSGSFVITAAPNGNNSIKWYETTSSAAPIHTGNSYLTPMITSSTTYYAAAFAGKIDTVTVGTGTTASSGFPNPFCKTWGGNRHQYLITAQELTALGARRGAIRSIALDIVTLSQSGTTAQQTMNDLTIRLAHSNNVNMSAGFQTTGLETVYNASFLPVATGWNELSFTSPFYWDGISNIIVEFTSNSGNTGGGGQHTIRHTATTGFVSGYYRYADNVTPATAAGLWNTTSTSGAAATTSNRANMQLIFDDICEGPRVPVNVVILPKTVAEVTPNGNVGLCDGSSRTLKSVNTASAYVWLRNGVAIPNSNRDSLVVTSTGSYQLVTIENTCTDTSDIVTVGTAPSPVVDLGRDYDICRNTATVLDAQNASNSIVWDDNSTNVLRTVTAAGTYYVTVTNSWNCVGSDTIVIGYLPQPNPQLGNDTSLCKNTSLTLRPGSFAQYLWSDNSTQPTLTVTDTGKYYVTVTNAAGCMEADTVRVGLYPTAEVEGFTYIPYFFEQRGKVQFAPINPRYVSSYSWDFGDNSPADNNRSPLHVYEKEGRYVVKLEVSNNICPPMLYQQEIALNFSTDITELGNAIKARLYPNPAQETVNVELDDVTVAILDVEVYDMLGRKVLTDAAVQGYKAVMDTRPLVSGVYQVAIQTTKGVFKAKFEIVK